MFLMDPLTKTLFFVFLVGSMLGIGLKVGKDEILTVVRDKSWLVRMFVANFILIPAAGILAAKLLAVKPENALALIVLACAPGGLSSLQFLTKTKERTALAYDGGTMVLLSFLAIFITPFLISLAIPEGMAVTMPYGSAILFVSLFMLLPLILGILVHDAIGPVAFKIGGPVSLIATLAFIGVLVRLGNITKWAKGEIGTKGILAIVVFILIAMLLGWLLGGPRRFTRRVLAAISSMRNIALCLAIAVRSFEDVAVLAPLVAFLAIMVPMNLGYTILSKAAGKMAEKRAAAH